MPAVNYVGSIFSLICTGSGAEADWQREAVIEALEELRDHITLQDAEHRGHSRSVICSRARSRNLDAGSSAVTSRWHQSGASVALSLVSGCFAAGASRSEAIRFLALRWGLQLERMLVMAGQQGDAELLGGLPATVLPADHDPCLLRQRQQRVYLSTRSSVAAVLDGLNHFRFVGQR